MHKGEALFRMFFQDTTEHTAFLRAHNVVVSDFTSTDEWITHQFIVEVRNEEGYLWSFDDKPAKVIIDNDWNCAFVSWCEDGMHRIGKPAFADITPGSATTLEWWRNGKKINRQAIDISDLTKEQQDAEMWKIWKVIK